MMTNYCGRARSSPCKRQFGPSAVVVRSDAVQVSQQGPFVFLVRNNIATVTPNRVARLLGAETVIESGLAGGDVVVTDGHLQLTDGARVRIRESRPGA